VVILELRGYRTFRLAHGAVYFGRSATFRWDAPDGSFGVLYYGDSPACALLETLHTTGARVVVEADLRARGLAELTPLRPLRLVDLRGGPGLAHLGVDTRLAAGSYRLAQRWSAALHDHPDRPDGLVWPSRHDPLLLSLAVFDRAADALDLGRTGPWMDPPNDGVLVEILARYRIGLL
jgi:hypothetical protein